MRFREPKMLNPDFQEILSTFSDERVEFLLVGAYAVAAHGIPRATGDIDLWIRPTPDNARRVWSALEIFGAPLSRFSPADFKKTGQVIQIGVAPGRIDLLTSIDGVEFDDAWHDRILVKVDGVIVPTISRPHLIANKRATARPQDLADAERLSELPEPPRR
jgi:hypothetical protein